MRSAAKCRDIFDVSSVLIICRPPCVFFALPPNRSGKKIVRFFSLDYLMWCGVLSHTPLDKRIKWIGNQKIDDVAAVSFHFFFFKWRIESERETVERQEDFNPLSVRSNDDLMTFSEAHTKITTTASRHRIVLKWAATRTITKQAIIL